MKEPQIKSLERKLIAALGVAAILFAMGVSGVIVHG